jgi:hypothetical protein
VEELLCLAAAIVFDFSLYMVSPSFSSVSHILSLTLHCLTNTLTPLYISFRVCVYFHPVLPGVAVLGWATMPGLRIPVTTNRPSIVSSFPEG